MNHQKLIERLTSIKSEYCHSDNGCGCSICSLISELELEQGETRNAIEQGARYYIYFAHIVDNYYKVGWSENPKKRVNHLGLSVDSIAHLIEVCDPVTVESVIHDLLKANWVPSTDMPDHVRSRLRTGLGEVYEISHSVMGELKTIKQVDKHLGLNWDEK